jgi:tetratricopeptide (TPR) repeat protein
VALLLPRALWPALVFGVTVACFAPAIHGSFVNWDDEYDLLENARYRGFSRAHLAWMFTSVRNSQYQPLAWLTFAVDHAIWGLAPHGYHLTNVLLHGVNAALAYALVLELLFRAGRPARRVAAAVGAAFFALHPLRVEAVAWVSERKELLCAAFYLLTLLAYLRATRSTRRRGWLVASLAAFVVSFLAKPWGMTLPAVLLVLDAYPLRRFRSEGVLRLLTEKLPFATVAVFFAVVTSFALDDAIRPSLSDYGIAQRASQAAYGLCFYVAKTVLPVALSPLYPYDPRLDPRAPRYIASAVVVVAAAVIVLAGRRRAPWLAAAVAAYALAIFPVLGFAQAGVQEVAGRYSYIACLPWAVLAAAAFDLAWERAGAARVAVATVAVAVLSVYAVLAVRQIAIWKDSITLWSYAVEVDPRNVPVLLRRGHTRLLAGDLAGAVVDYEAGLAIAPDDPALHNDRAHARYKLGDLKGAIADYNATITAEPHYAGAHYNRGIVWQALGNADAADADYGEAIRRAPDDPRPRNNRGVLRAERGDLAGAIEDYTAAIAADPKFAQGYLNRARAHRMRGVAADAIADVEAALRVAPPGWAKCAAARQLLAQLGVRDVPPPRCAEKVR